ncbi:hypothetical protein KBZ21_44895, partial [Streptomyces sp. A73]|nr:hypothetical protein [Streptomyces sp. A73]MBQ1165129.1 hypothetical protein [Streptomyces sp. A73]
DGITPDQAIAAIDWALANDFWQAHILSPAKLRAKYETLRRQAMSERRKQPAGPQPTKNIDDMSEEEIQRALRFG